MAEGHYTGVEAKQKNELVRGIASPKPLSSSPRSAHEQEDYAGSARSNRGPEAKTSANRQPVDISEFPVAPLTTGTGKVAEPDSKRAGPSPNKPERQRVDTKKIIKSLQQQLDELAEREKERKRQKADKMARYRERRRQRENDHGA